MKRVVLAIGAAAFLATAGGCVTNPKRTVLNLDTTDPKWTSRKCVAARKDVYEYSDHGTTRAVVGVAGNLVVPFAGTASSLALSKAQDHKRRALNQEVLSACVSKHRRFRD
jgi:hypothetical protein